MLNEYSTMPLIFLPCAFSCLTSLSIVYIFDSCVTFMKRLSLGRIEVLLNYIEGNLYAKVTVSTQT